MTWDVKTEFVGNEPDREGKDTQLTKITTTHVDTGQTYFLKARMATDAYKKAAWDNIWAQHLERTKVVTDALGDEGKSDLEGRVP